MPGVAPLAPAAEQVLDADREVVVGVHQPRRRRDDAVAVGVGVVGEGDVEAVRDVAQARHRVRRRAVHADLAVPVERHEAEGRVELVVDDLELEPWRSAIALPVAQARAAERVDAEPQARAADRVEVDRPPRGRRRRRVDVVAPLHARASSKATRLTPSRPASSSSLAASSIAPVTSVSAGPPCGGLYLKPPSPGGLCDGVTTMPSAVPRPPPRLWVRIACEITGVGVAPSSASSTTSTPWAAEHLDDRARGGLRQRVRVAAEEQRAVDPCAGAVARDGLGDGEHVRLVERARGRGAAVAGGAERHALGRLGRVGALVVVRRDQRVDVDQVVGAGQLAGAGVVAHRPGRYPGYAAARLELADGAAQQPRDVHLRVPQPLPDLGLRELLAEVQLDDRAVALVERARAASPAPSGRAPTRSRRPSIPSVSSSDGVVAVVVRASSRRASSRAALDRRRAPRAPPRGSATRRRPARPRSATRRSRCPARARAVDGIARSCSSRGTRTDQPQSRKWRLIAPAIDGTA